MLRRNFFATLLAPLVARFAPKPIPLVEVINSGINPEWTGNLTVTISTAQTIAAYWHGRNPYVIIDIPERWPWDV